MSTTSYTISNTALNTVQYLKSVANTYDKNKSMNEILEEFRVMSKEFQDFAAVRNELRARAQSKYTYSSPVYHELTGDEKRRYDTTLMLVESLVTNSIYDRTGRVRNWKEVVDIMMDPAYTNTPKINRKVVYSTVGSNRPIGGGSYALWNGLQIIDLDIKNEELATKLKPVLFESLKRYSWFLGVAKSASGKSLHVWTKITPISIDPDRKKIEYLCNFRHKYSYVYVALLMVSKEYGFKRDDIKTYMDMAMAKPQQGIFISSDATPLISTNFDDVRLDVNFEGAFDNGIESVDWIAHSDLVDIFAKLDWFTTDDTFVKNVDIDMDDVETAGCENVHYTKQHYKHAKRWQLANTLTKLYGPEMALIHMKKLCSGTPVRELMGDVKTASLHNKPVSIWAVKELNDAHGFNIVLKDSIVDSMVSGIVDSVNTRSAGCDNNAATALNGSLVNEEGIVHLHLNSDQYLSHLRDDIIGNLSQHITLLEAGAGYGKTEMIKALGSRVLLILPFTSTIKSKIEADTSTSDWLHYYGKLRPTMVDLMGTKSMAMTIDKFSKLNVMELDAAKFDYVVLDESHLLFTSSYRSVMAPTIQRLANISGKVIMMTGTPTGEKLFFPNIAHIRVQKDDNREKVFEMHMCHGNDEVRIEMAKSIATDIMAGRKILFPTNDGNVFYDQTIGLVQQYLNEAQYPRKIKSFYYKKSNVGDDSMDDINVDKTVGDNDIVLCTTYLSVGVDICDKYEFCVYFHKQWIPQDIEQFANRLRNNNLYIKMFLPKTTEDGVIIDYNKTLPLDLYINQDDMVFARDLVRTCNDMIKRNVNESKFNPVVSAILSGNKFLKYDENDGNYYIDETAYKLKVYEERYNEYAKQMNIMVKGLKYFGYDVRIENHGGVISDARKEEVDAFLKECRNTRYDYVTTETLNFLDHVTDSNIDIYKELLRGNYEVFRDAEYAELRGDMNLYVTDIEVLEKNIPIVVSLYKYYDPETIKDIYTYCIDTKKNKINYTKLNRIRKFVTIEANRRKNRLDFPVKKFIREAQKWVYECDGVAPKADVDAFKVNWACKFANAIPGTVVEDVPYLKKIHEHICDLWNVIVVCDKPKKGVINMKPFELLWTRKELLVDIYGNKETREFFNDLLIDNIKDIDNNEDNNNINIYNKETEDDNGIIGGTEATEIDAIEMPVGSKVHLDDIKDTLGNILHRTYEYSKYSVSDGSNDRFMIKQRKESSLNEDVLSELRAYHDTDTTSYMGTMDDTIEPESEPTLFSVAI